MQDSRRHEKTEEKEVELGVLLYPGGVADVCKNRYLIMAEADEIAFRESSGRLQASLDAFWARTQSFGRKPDD